MWHVSAGVVELPTAGRYASVSGTRYQILNTNQDLYVTSTQIWCNSSGSPWCNQFQMTFSDEFGVSGNVVVTKGSSGKTGYSSATINERITQVYVCEDDNWSGNTQALVFKTLDGTEFGDP